MSVCQNESIIKELWKDTFQSAEDEKKKKTLLDGKHSCLTMILYSRESPQYDAVLRKSINREI